MFLVLDIFLINIQLLCHNFFLTDFNQILTKPKFVHLLIILVPIMKIQFLFFASFIFLSNHLYSQSISVDTLFKDKISIRAIAFDNDTIYYGAADKKLGFVSSKAKLQTEVSRVPADSDFRSIALTSEYVYYLTSGNPAKLFKYPRKFRSYDIVYEESHEKVFYDSMNFWNDNEGIAIGDPIEDCLSIIITRDGGKTWKKTSCTDMPKIVPGEAAFASSNTNICIKGDKTWVVTGGKKSRVFYSPDKGRTWEVFETPIVQGKAMTGIFTADFYDEEIGFIAGGNYEEQNQDFQNKAITFDGGKTWKLVAENSGFGYASCVQFVPNSDGKKLVTVGTSGLYYSDDSGNTWKRLLEDKTLYTIRFLDSNTAIAAGKDKIIRINFKK